MLHVRTTPTAELCVGCADELAVVIHLIDNIRVCIAHIRLVEVDDVPTLSTYVVALVFHGTLTEHNADRVLAELLVVGQRVLHLPVHAFVP